MSYKVRGTRSIQEEVNISGKEVYRIFNSAFREVTGLSSDHSINRDGNLIEATEMGGHTTWYDKNVVREATDEDRILLDLRRKIYDKLCKQE